MCMQGLFSLDVPHTRAQHHTWITNPPGKKVVRLERGQDSRHRQVCRHGLCQGLRPDDVGVVWYVEAERLAL